MSVFLKQTFVRFAIVGGAGFLIDLSAMLLLSLWLPPLIARSLAFWVAASSNWWWNRTFTFRTDLNNANLVLTNRHKKAAVLQWLQFLGGSLVAFIPNWGCYWLLLAYQGEIHQPVLASVWPYLSMVPGIALGMVLNFTFSRLWIFPSKTHYAKTAHSGLKAAGE